MRVSVNTFMLDFIDEGIGGVLDNLATYAQADGVTVACNYHHAQDVCVHNPRGVVRYHRGETYFQADGAQYSDTRIKPEVSPEIGQIDPLEQLVDAARTRGMAVRAWTNITHNSRLGERYPDLTVENAFGDHYSNALCPAKRDVRAFACATFRDLARYEVDTIRSETVGFQQFPHEYHHPRGYLPLSSLTRFLLGLCFCAACCAQGTSEDCDVEEVRRWAADLIRAELEGRPHGALVQTLTPDELGAYVGGALNAFLQSRANTVTSLVREAQVGIDRVRPTDLVLVDESSASLPDAEATPALIATSGWRDGFDLAPVLRACRGLSVLAYASDSEGVRRTVSAYRQAVPRERSFSISVRPVQADFPTMAEFADRATIVKEANPDWIEVYHYAFLPLERLAWIPRVLSNQGGQPT